jgi:hypothetical protein
MSDDDKIKARAHQIWEREGRPHGRHHEHWEEARRQVEAEHGRSTPEVEAPGDIADQTAPVAGSLVGKAASKPRRSGPAATQRSEASEEADAKSAAARNAAATSRDAKKSSASKADRDRPKSKS